LLLEEGMLVDLLTFAGLVVLYFAHDWGVRRRWSEPAPVSRRPVANLRAVRRG
jgi:hypothetical protein